MVHRMATSEHLLRLNPAITRPSMTASNVRDSSGWYGTRSREQAKLGYRWIPAAVERLVRDEVGGVARDETGEVLRHLCCPSCYAPIADD